MFFGGRDLDPKSLFQNATQKEEEDHRNHGTKPGSIERGRLRRVLEQSGNHGFVSAGRVERDGEENRRRVVRRDGVRDRAARRDGDVRGFVSSSSSSSRCVFSSGFWWCSFFLCGRGLVRGWRRLVAFFVTPFCRSVATSIGATGSGKVRRSPSVRSHLCRSHRGSNRKSLTVNISLSLSFSRTGTRRTTKNKRNSTTDSKQQREKKKKTKKKLGSRLPLHCV